MDKKRRDRVDEILAQWRRERPDLKVAPLGLFGRLFLVVHLADAALGKEFGRHGLQPGWFDLLATLRRTGSGSSWGWWKATGADAGRGKRSGRGRLARYG